MEHIGRLFHASHITQTTDGSVELPHWLAFVFSTVPDVELESMHSLQTNISNYHRLLQVCYHVYNIVLLLYIISGL